MRRDTQGRGCTRIGSPVVIKYGVLRKSGGYALKVTEITPPVFAHRSTPWFTRRSDACSAGNLVTRKGNQKAQNLVAEVMELRREFEWRGLGMVPYSALKIKQAFAGFDAEQRFDMPVITASDVKSCECPQILRGVKKPTDCKLFGTVCTPENPMGSCMVSSEGACAALGTVGPLG